MKICTMGTICTGKTTFIEDFIRQWPMYKRSEKTYRDILKKGDKGKHSRKSTQAVQEVILNSMIDEVKHHKPEDHVIFDRGVMDNLVFSMWLNNYKKGKVDDKYIEKTIPVVRKTFKLYDLVFFFPITANHDIPLTGENELRDGDKKYREELDTIFKVLFKQWIAQNDTFFPIREKEGCPAIIEIFGTREERIEMAKLYLNETGGVIGADKSLLEDHLKLYGPDGQQIPSIMMQQPKNPLNPT